MKYQNTEKAIFISRPNRFIANVELEGEVITVHVKNTGRCRELLLPGVEVILEKSDNPSRKTAYDLVSVFKDGLGFVNIDSQAPNKLVKEWLENSDFDYIKPEYTYGDSRIDFYMEKGDKKYLMEVKGCTLEIDGVGYFPDAPTVRGRKHLRELITARSEGYISIATFVIQMNGIEEVFANEATDPEFADTLHEAEAKGVKILKLKCNVTENEVRIISNDDIMEFS